MLPVGSITTIDKYFDPDYFDVVFLCGVVGWGLDKRADIEQATSGIFRCLRRKGILVLGWNDTHPRNETKPEELESLKSFKKYVFPPLDASEYRSRSSRYKVVFNFYEK